MVKKNRFFLFSFFCLVGLFGLMKLNLNQNSTSDRQLVIYSYSSFTSSWGPGPLLRKIFETQCDCNVEFRDADDSRMLIQRLKIEGERIGADLVLGLNQWDLEDAITQLKLKKIDISKLKIPNEDLFAPIQEFLNISESYVIPFDWGILTINTKTEYPISKIKNLQDLSEQLENKTLALQDPRTSAPGLSFLFWLIDALGEDSAFRYLEKIQNKILSITSGWSGSYGLFQKNQAQAVFSYVTSPLYHKIEESKSNYKALAFSEGQPIHIEFAGLLNTCKSCNLAEEFLEFLVSPEAQEILMKKNYMFPVIESVMKGTDWDIVQNYKLLPIKQVSNEYKSKVIDRWQKWIRQKD